MTTDENFPVWLLDYGEHIDISGRERIERIC